MEEEAKSFNMIHKLLLYLEDNLNKQRELDKTCRIVEECNDRPNSNGSPLYLY
jgi:hypothetical protein